ncbi:MAG: hypothetical protein Q8R91_07475 [Candidatus Omnitrophota bacterium]|nr:hypothetical protein [Candidatus Omnitrophota bacterium]
MRRRRGQSTLEYAVVIGVVAAALVVMQIYMKGGIQGKLREATDDVGEQFSPTAYRAQFQTVQHSATEETLHVQAGVEGGLDQAAGESRSKTIEIGEGEDAIEHIATTRTSVADDDGLEEQLTDAQSEEVCLFPPCP